MARNNPEHLMHWYKKGGPGPSENVSLSQLFEEIEANTQPPKRRRQWVRAPLTDADGIIVSSGRRQQNPSRRPMKLPVTSSTVSRQQVILESAEESTSNVQEMLNDLEGDLAPFTEPNQARPSSWRIRQSHMGTKWAETRSRIFGSIASASYPPPEQCCDECANTAVIRCRQCSSYFCVAHDIARHKYNGCHDRLAFFDGYFLPILSNFAVRHDDEHFTIVETDVYPEFCSKVVTCKYCYSRSLTVQTYGSAIVVTVNGRYDVKLPQFVCDDCQEVSLPTVESAIAHGYWPSSPVLSTGLYYFDAELLEHFHLLRMENPGLSCNGFLSALGLFSQKRDRTAYISPTAFRTAVREWQKCTFELESLGHADPMACPACSEGMHACHVDGNKKLYRYAGRNQDTSEASYYRGVFIVNDQHVDDYVKQVKSTSVAAGENTCGTTHWQVARASSCKSMSSQVETGLCLAACRHAVLLRAINMFQGEIFAYPLYVMKSLADHHSITFMCQDVICKFWPWLQRLREIMPTLCINGDVKPFLSVMHAKAHDWACQILNGGRWQPGSCAQTGEEVEQVNSYLSRAGFVTKTMTKAGREDELTLHAIHWNMKKILKLPALMVKWYNKSIAMQEKLHTELLTLAGPSHVESVQQWAAELQDIARGMKAKSTVQKADIETLYELQQAILHAQCLRQFCNSTSAGQCMVLGLETLYDAVQSRAGSDTATLQQQYINLLANSTDEGRLLQEGQQSLGLRKKKELQDQIEMYLSSIRQKTYDISKGATHSKERSRLRSSIARDKKAVSALLLRYNRLESLNLPGFIPLSSQHIEADTDLPWMAAAGKETLRHKRMVVEKALLRERYKEEQKQLVKEMRSYTGYHKRMLQQIDFKLSELSELEAVSTTDRQGCYGIRSAASDSTEALGITALLQSKAAAVRRQLSRAAAEFSSVLTSEGHVVGNESCSEEDDESTDNDVDSEALTDDDDADVT